MAQIVLPVSKGGRRYGRFYDNPHHPARYSLRITTPPETVNPPSASLVKFMGPIRDQGQEGSCTGQMGAEIRDLLYRKYYEFETDKSVPAEQFKSAASFIYKCNLIGDGDLGQDAGSTIHRTFITLNQQGACLETTDPYSDQDYTVPPNQKQYDEGLLFKSGAYHYIPDLKTMKSCIASGYPFGFGITVYESFEGTWAKPGFMPLPDVRKEQVLGGHAQAVLAYDDNLEFPDGSKGGFGIQNSWGEGWGIALPDAPVGGGMYWMPYTFVDAGLSSDAWVTHLGKAWG
jgi:C1A family cysteine protease